MRFAIFVAVVAAHIALLWLFPTLRRLVLLPVADEPAVTPVFLPPQAVRQEPPQQHAMREAGRVKKGLRPAVEPQATSEPNAALAPEATSASVLDLYLFASHDRLQNRPGGDGQRGPVQVHAQAGEVRRLGLEAG